MTKRLSLIDAPVGKPIIVHEIHGGKGVQSKLQALGVRVGVSVTKVSGSFAGGPIVLQVGGTQTALGRGLCKKIVMEAAR